MMLTKELWQQAFTYIFGGYAVIMGLMPGKMVTDNFNAPATPMLEFWIRGESIQVGGLVYCLSIMPTAQAFDITLAVLIATGILYPLNAVFGFIGGKMPVKYTGFPNHRVPEILFTGMIASGLYLKFFA